jgi:antitoxin HigA-1
VVATRIIARVGRMHNPPHPGEILADECLKPLGLSVTATAAALGVSRKTLSLILNGHAGITASMALRLAKAFGTSPDVWLRLQNARDLWEARETRTARIRRLIAHG